MAARAMTALLDFLPHFGAFNFGAFKCRQISVRRVELPLDRRCAERRPFRREEFGGESRYGGG